MRAFWIGIVGIMLIGLVGACAETAVNYATWLNKEKVIVKAGEAAQTEVATIRAELIKLRADTANMIEAARKPLLDDIVKLKAAQPSYNWILYIFAGLCIVGGLPAGYFLKQFMPVSFSWSGVRADRVYSIPCRLPLAMWIPFGLITATFIVFIWDYFVSVRKVQSKDAALTAIIPAIEQAEPKVEGFAPSGPIKAAILRAADKAGVTTVVADEITAVKAKINKTKLATAAKLQL